MDYPSREVGDSPTSALHRQPHMAFAMIKYPTVEIYKKKAKDMRDLFNERLQGLHATDPLQRRASLIFIHQGASRSPLSIYVPARLQERVGDKFLQMDGKKPYIVVVVIQSIYAGLAILSKAAFNGGMSTFIFMFYRQAIAAGLLAPVAVAIERNTAPPLSFKMLAKIFMVALLGITFSLNVYNMALRYTSSTVAIAASNMVPVATFFLAVLLQMETIKMRSISGVTKVMGIALCLAGIIVTALYKGPILKPLNHQHPILHASTQIYANHEPDKEWIKGSFLMLVGATSWAIWIVLQGLILEEYPSKLLFAALISFFSSMQCFVVAVAIEGDFGEWKLHCDAGLLAIVYSGVFVAGIGFYLQAWCIEKKGPVFLAMSNPLALVITIACSSLLLGEIINLGSVLGGVLMVGGLYSVLWAKSRETVDQKPSIEGGIDQSGAPQGPDIAPLIRPLRLHYPD